MSVVEGTNTGLLHYIPQVKWEKLNSKPYYCGAMTGAATTDWDEVNCADCFNVGRGVGTPTPHTPPRMEDERGMVDGVFVFHDTHIEGCLLEVVPQTSGNVEITHEYDGEEHLFSLNHLDRADLIRALLHDFHYSPERGGPNDQV